MTSITTLNPNDLIYVEDVIEMFEGKITKNIVYAWVREKKLKAMKVGRRYVFSRKAVLAYMHRLLGTT